MKYCYRCKVTKTTGEFRNNVSKKDGLASQCKPCSKEIETVSYNNKRDKYLESRRRYYINNRDKMRAAMSRWREVNREKVLVDHKQYYQDHREIRMAYQRQYHLDHPDVASRARAKRRIFLQVALEDVKRQEVYIRDNGVCGICQEAVDPQDWHLDHIVPLSRGGEHSYKNVQVTHPGCNRHKWATMSV